MKRYLPWIAGAVFLLYLAVPIVGPDRFPGGVDVAEFGRLPVLMSGRVMPVDSVARMGLMQIRRTSNVPLESGNILTRRSLTATEWLLELLVKPEIADTRKVFAIDDPTALRKLGLKPEVLSGGYYSFDEIASKLGEISKDAARIIKLKSPERTPWEQQWLRLGNAVFVYGRLKNSLQPNSSLQREAEDGKAAAYDFAARLAGYQANLKAAVDAATPRERGEKHEIDKATEEALRNFVRPYIGLARTSVMAIIPPTDLVRARNHWENIGTVVVASARTGVVPAPVAHFAAMSSAYEQGKPDAFNRELSAYREWLRKTGLGYETSRARYEAFYTRSQAYVSAVAIYLVAVILLGVYLITRSTVFYRPAVVLSALACVLHTGGLLFGMMIEGRPPLANLFASIVFIGWCAVAVGSPLERIVQNGIALTAAVVAALVALTSAYSLATDGAVTLIRMVFDLNFGLAALAVVIAFAVSLRSGASSEMREAATAAA